MSHNAGQQHQLIQLLQGEVAVLEQLEAALATEHDALCGTDAEKLEIAVNGKQTALDRLEQRSLARVRWLREAGIANQADTIAAALANSEEGHNLLQQLRESLQRCQYRNRLHGAIIQLSQTRTQRALNLLRGTEENPSYGPRGQAYGSQAPNGHTLGTA